MAELPPTPDFVALIRRASVSDEARPIAAEYFGQVIRDRNPLSADHGSHVLRPSSFGRCSLEFVADNLGLHDLTEADDKQLVMDTGSLLGLWLGCLLKAGAKSEGVPFDVILEAACSYRGVPGNIDALIEWRGTPVRREPVEFKSTPSSGAIKSPADRKTAQVLQVTSYALAPSIASERGTIVTFGYQVGADRSGIPHPKLVQHTFATADWKPQVDAEIDRLESLTRYARLEMAANSEKLADAVEAFRCSSCAYSGCSRNTNPIAFAL